jgi:uncharacterized protein YukE
MAYENGYEIGKNVGGVRYDELPGRAKMIRDDGRDLNNNVILVYKSIDDMKVHWHGRRYNEFVTKFNSLIPGFNEILTLCVTTLPVALEQIANNYAIVDTGNKIVAVSDEAPTPVPEIAPSPDSEFRFMQGEVENIRTMILGKFDIMLDIMNKISDEINTLPWKSDASEIFRTRFEALKSNVVRNLEDIKTEFDSTIMTVAEEVSHTETNNLN